jgi:hypothetical protein
MCIFDIPAAGTRDFKNENAARLRVQTWKGEKRTPIATPTRSPKIAESVGRSIPEEPSHG